MPRRTRLIFAACLGVPLTLIFALLPILWSHRFKYDAVQIADQAWPTTPPPTWPASANEGHRINAHFGWTTLGANHGLEAIANSRRTDPNATWYSMVERRSGLPFRCLRRTQMSTQVMRTVTPVPLTTWVEGVPSPPWFHDGKTSKDRIPIRPLPLGLAANYLFWSALAWAALFAASALRARIRQRRGSCPACGYALAGLPTCPECGDKR